MASSHNPISPWVTKLEGLSDDPLRRAAQIALAALDQVLTSGDLDDDDATAAVAAYDALKKRWH
jgi:hypothetical protein